VSFVVKRFWFSVFPAQKPISNYRILFANLQAKNAVSEQKSGPNPAWQTGAILSVEDRRATLSPGVYSGMSEANERKNQKRRVLPHASACPE
jgi:hypothetical protein